MKKLFFLILVIAVTITQVSYSAEVSLTDTQLKNLNYIQKSVKEAYPKFSGFHGTQGNLVADGIESSNELQSFIDGLNLEAIKQGDDSIKKIKKLGGKLKALGLDDEDLNTMGLTDKTVEGVSWKEAK